MRTIQRRQILKSAVAAGVLSSQLGETRLRANRQSPSGLDVKTISLQHDRYLGWPTLTRRSNGELLVVCSGGREQHVCPFGRVDLIRSFDNGETWTYPRTILDGPIDDRDAGILETSSGTLLVSTFTSLAYVPELERSQKNDGSSSAKDAQQLARWAGAHNRVADGNHQSHLGCWLIRSEDGGTSWSPAYRVPVNSPHGPINLTDGRLLYAGVALWTKDRKVQVCDSTDDGRTWKVIADIPTRPGDLQKNYHELHAVEAADGTIVVQIRNHNQANNRETLQTHSTDGGISWATPYEIGVWGLPSHLLRLADDRLLMTYGHRRSPIGNQARFSSDHGRTWSSAVIIYGDGKSTDLGYPSTVETTPGNLVTVWYERLSGSSNAQLRMSTWSTASTD